jgi:hypothetical protein
MGWTESPGYFCAATETGRNILQALMDAKVQLPPHQFNSFITPATPARRQTSARSTRSWQIPAVYVDDYVLATVESHDGSNLDRVGRAALHTIHGLYPPPAQSDHVGGKDPISLKIRSRRRPMGEYQEALRFCV